jgi:hypothetical protein
LIRLSAFCLLHRGEQLARLALGSKPDLDRAALGVEEKFGKIFNFGIGVSGDGREFDRLFGDRDRFGIGNMQSEVIAVQGQALLHGAEWADVDPCLAVKRCAPKRAWRPGSYD